MLSSQDRLLSKGENCRINNGSQSFSPETTTYGIVANIWIIVGSEIADVVYFCVRFTMVIFMPSTRRTIATPRNLPMSGST